MLTKSIAVILGVMLGLSAVNVALEQEVVLQDVEFTWTTPTQYKDGSPLSTSSISSYDLACGTTVGTYDTIYSTPGKDNTYYKQKFGEGMWYCVMRTVATDGLRSDPTNPVSFQVGVLAVDPTPLPPTSVYATALQVVYTLQLSDGSMSFVPVGKMATGSTCDLNQHATDRNGRTAFIVKKPSVTWSGSVRTKAVFAECAPKQ